MPIIETTIYSVFVLKYAALYLKNWPKDYVFPFGIISYIGLMLWGFIVRRSLFLISFVFNQMCYYLKLRFKHINEGLNHLKCYQSSYTLFILIKGHHNICNSIEKYNKFWSNLLLIDAIFYSILFLIYNYINLHSNKALTLFSTLLINSSVISAFLYIYMSASSVSKQVQIN